ncbi:MAG: MAPEG family protein [Granulosicoccus sp.]
MITPSYAAALALIFLVLSARTILVRRSIGVGLGDGNNKSLTKAIRAHGNFAEYVPITLLLCYFLEVLPGGVSWVVHVSCASLLVGRVLHAAGVSRLSEDFRYRVAGTALTLSALGLAAIGVLFVQILN